MENRDEHWRYILQEILRFGALENCGVLPQFVGDLINNEFASLFKGVVRFSQQRALLVDLENAEWDARENVIARSETVTFQLERQRRRIAMNHVNTTIGCKLALQCSCERRIE